jgi:hypothetical protein
MSEQTLTSAVALILGLGCLVLFIRTVRTHRPHDATDYALLGLCVVGVLVLCVGGLLGLVR